MPAIRVQIRRFVDPWQPGWVECVLIDALGVEHLFVEKVPVVTLADLDADSDYPQPGVIRCVVLDRRIGPDGREIVDVDTRSPDGVESTAGLERFEVSSDQLVREDADDYTS